MSVRALIIGSNYSHRSFSLRHAEADAIKFQTFLKKYYPDLQITLMLGEQTTKENLLKALKTKVEQTQPGDILFLYFSGHGTYVFDQSGDEDDSRDEAILAWDSPNFKEVEYLITDDQLYQILSKLPAGAKFRAVLDACHSGTLLDLDGKIQLMKGMSDRIGVFRLRKGMVQRSAFDGILLSSSKDSEKSYEDSRGGLLTEVLVQHNPKMNPLELLQLLQAQLKDQTPVLSATSSNLGLLFP